MCVVFYLGAGGSGGQEGDGEKGTVGKVGRTTGGQGRRPGQFWRPARRQGEKPGQLWRQTWRPSGCGEVLRGSVVVTKAGLLKCRNLWGCWSRPGLCWSRPGLCWGLRRSRGLGAGQHGHQASGQHRQRAFGQHRQRAFGQHRAPSLPSSFELRSPGTSLAVQGLRLHLPGQRVK